MDLLLYVIALILATVIYYKVHNALIRRKVRRDLEAYEKWCEDHPDDDEEEEPDINTRLLTSSSSEED